MSKRNKAKTVTSASITNLKLPATVFVSLCAGSIFAPIKYLRVFSASFTHTGLLGSFSFSASTSKIISHIASLLWALAVFAAAFGVGAVLLNAARFVVFRKEKIDSLRSGNIPLLWWPVPQKLDTDF